MGGVAVSGLAALGLELFRSDEVYSIIDNSRVSAETMRLQNVAYSTIAGTASSVGFYMIRRKRRSKNNKLSK